MSIITEYIDNNAELLNNLAKENSDLAAALVEALAVLEVYTSENQVQFSEETKLQIISSAKQEVAKEAVQESENDLIERSKELLEAAEILDKSSKNKLLPSTYEVLRLNTVGYSGEVPMATTVTNGSWEDLWNAVKEIYKNDPSNLQQIGYDKVLFEVTWGVGYNYARRLDIGNNGDDPFDNRNPLLVSVCASFAVNFYRWMYGLGYEKRNSLGQTTTSPVEWLIYYSFLLSKCEWQIAPNIIMFEVVRKCKSIFQSQKMFNMMLDDRLAAGLKTNVKMGAFSEGEIETYVRRFFPRDFQETYFEGKTLDTTLVDQLSFLETSNTSIETALEDYVKEMLTDLTDGDKLNIAMVMDVSPTIAQPISQTAQANVSIEAAGQVAAPESSIQNSIVHDSKVIVDDLTTDDLAAIEDIENIDLDLEDLSDLDIDFDN